MSKPVDIEVPDYVKYLDSILDYISEIENTECKKEELYQGITGYKFKQNPGKDEKYGEFDSENPSLLVLSGKGVYHNQTLFEKSVFYLEQGGYLNNIDRLIIITGKGLAKKYSQNFSTDYIVQYNKKEESSANLNYIKTQTTLFWFVFALSVLSLTSTCVDIYLRLDSMKVPTEKKCHKNNHDYHTKTKKQHVEGKGSANIIPIK